MKIDKEFILREIAGDYVIIPTGTTTLEFNGLITVNELGAFIWERLQEETTEEKLIEAIVEEYEVDEETAEADLKEFLDILKECRILNS